LHLEQVVPKSTPTISRHRNYEMRQQLRSFLELNLTQNFIIAVIIINAITLGLETSGYAMAKAGWLIIGIDMVALAIFVIELGLRIYAYGWRFFTSAWNLFDFAIVAISLLPLSSGLTVLRALRILRAFRLISAVPKMRQIVDALIRSIPALGSVTVLMGLLFYVSAVLATKLFGGNFEQWFGSIPQSLYSLFQIMTLESWSMGIVRPILEVQPYAWLFFVPFILITSFAVLNLFIAVIVNAMQSTEHQQTDNIELIVERLEQKIDTLQSDIKTLKNKKD